MKLFAWTASVPFIVLLASSCSTQGGRAGHEREGEGEKKVVKVPERVVVEIKAPALEGAEGAVVARYETRYLDPVLEEMRKRDKDWQARQDEATGKILEKQKEKKEKQRKEKKELKSSLPADQCPASPEDFKQVFHQPPTAQYYTGTCWSFATTSFLESEVHRITGKEVKLAEMSTVYWEYLAKASGFVRERGDSLFAEGSESNAVTRVWKEHGTWPLEAYPGQVGEDGRYDHIRMFREMEALLESVEAKSLWDEETVLSMVEVILERHLGGPPDSFDFEGKSMTSMEFMNDVLQIKPDDYVEFFSTLSIPFYTRGEFKVPDNWWHDESYHNVPLDEFYGALKKAVQDGYSLSIALDYSEPGRDGEHDVLFIPDYDIPGDKIDQVAREYRIAHEVTTDDHGVHLVGHVLHAGHDWFLVKDSSRSARRGKHKGYYFVRDDYIRLKMLAFTVHKDAVKDLLSRFKP